MYKTLGMDLEGSAWLDKVRVTIRQGPTIRKPDVVHVFGSPYVDAMFIEDKSPLRAELNRCRLFAFKTMQKKIQEEGGFS